MSLKRPPKRGVYPKHEASAKKITCFDYVIL